MASRKFFILFVAVFAMVAMLVSCQSRTVSPWPSTAGGAIATTSITVEGNKERGETLRIEFNRVGECVQAYVGKEQIKTDCKGFELNETYFCIRPDEKHKSKTTIYGKKGSEIDAYCGNVLELTDGADIRFESNPADGNRKCKNVGGQVICYPPL